MRYSGYIDNLLADAAYAKKTGDASWLTKRLDYEEDPIKRMFLRLVCTPAFIESVRREGGWLRETKRRLEEIALDAMESDYYFNAEEINRHMQELLGNSDTKDDEMEDVLGLLGDEDDMEYKGQIPHRFRVPWWAFWHPYRVECQSSLVSSSLI